jgi:hypothetical protein
MADALPSLSTTQSGTQMNEMNSNPMTFSRTSKRIGTNRVLRGRRYNAYPMSRKLVAEEPHLYNPVKHRQLIAFHVAGHATAIYLNIKARNLPPIFFQIMLQELNNLSEEDFDVHRQANQDCGTQLKGGRFIEMLPAAMETSEPSIKDTMRVYEADIVNLLAGPLAEARYVSEIDNETFSHRLIHLKALKNYGGHSDLALVDDYLLSFSDNPQERDEKLKALFVIAFNFINEQANWAAITKLAYAILESQQDAIDYEAVVSLIED